MGLGLLGRGVGDAVFLAECGAKLTITDLKPSTALRPSLQKLRKFKNIKYVLGKHRLEDFRDKDMIIKNPAIPLDSIYIKEAKKNKIPVEMDVSLFVKLTKGVVVVGVTGTRGKSMTTMLVYEILKKNEKILKGAEVFLGGNIKGKATLPLLKKTKPGDILICELDSWQLQGFDPISLKLRETSEKGISPRISVFTSFMPDHMNYYGSTGLTTSGAMKKYFADKANIFKYQNKGDVLIVRPHVKKLIPKTLKSRLIVADVKKIAGYKFIVPGEHQRENLACAVEVAKLFKIPTAKIKKVIKNFKGLEGRLQYVRTIKGVKIYNDNNATTPEATMAGIKALFQDGKENKIILISGGADKNLDTKIFESVINTFCKAVIFIPGTGTDKLLKNHKLKIPNEKVKDLKTAVKKALKYAKAGDVILFSPAFSSFSQFANEYERGDLFMKIMKKFK